MHSRALHDVLFSCAVTPREGGGALGHTASVVCGPSNETAMRLSKSKHVPVLRRIVALQTIAVATFFGSACTGSVPMPSSDISSGQAIIDLGNALGQLREDNALLQADLDSLRAVVAYQDSIVRQLAALSNVSMRSPSVVVP